MRKIDKIKEENALALSEGISVMQETEFKRRMELQKVLNEDKDESRGMKIAAVAIPAALTFTGVVVNALVNAKTTNDKLEIKKQAYNMTTQAELTGSFVNMSTKSAINEALKIE